jgi:hypothetical protein
MVLDDLEDPGAPEPFERFRVRVLASGLGNGQCTPDFPHHVARKRQQRGFGVPNPFNGFQHARSADAV